MERSILDSFLSQGREMQLLFRQFRDKTSVHAYLITGEKGTGKKTLARLLGASLLCTSDGERPCGICKSCILTEKGEHPDLIIIEPGTPLSMSVKKDRQTIPVEDIREMIRLCGVRSTEGNMHVVLIFGAEKMTVQAQNCLLKTLEEPPSDTCMILVTDQPEILLPTVLSRCRMIRLKAWDDDYVRKVLRERDISTKHIDAAVSASDGSVGKALEIAADDQYWELREEVMKTFFSCSSRSEVIRISNAWKDRKQDADRILGILGQFVSMMSEARFFPDKATDLSGFPANWQRFSKMAGPERFVLLTEAIASARNQLQYSVNFQAVVEKLLFTFIGEGSTWQQ